LRRVCSAYRGVPTLRTIGNKDGQVEERSAQTIHLVNDHAIDLARLDICQQPALREAIPVAFP